MKALDVVTGRGRSLLCNQGCCVDFVHLLLSWKSFTLPAGSPSSGDQSAGLSTDVFRSGGFKKRRCEEDETFERAKAWVKELQRQASPNIVIALAGNKADLADKRLVEYEEAQTYAEDTGLLFMETSAKTAMNVNELFLAIAKKMPKTDTQNPTHAARHRGVNLQDPDAQSARSCCGN
ncbi:hypothetical protein AOLI_G00081310 [Acnodon oligacanthus]